MQLCEMPSIEILDISRNKIRKLPQNPGTLVNLKVSGLASQNPTLPLTWLSQLAGLLDCKEPNQTATYLVHFDVASQSTQTRPQSSRMAAERDHCFSNDWINQWCSAQ